MEMSSDEDKDAETKTIMASEASSQNMQFYQMKLLPASQT
jgi:hypothetical protein